MNQARATTLIVATTKEYVWLLASIEVMTINLSQSYHHDRLGGTEFKFNWGVSSNWWQALQRGSNPNSGASKGHYGLTGLDPISDKRTRDGFGNNWDQYEHSTKNSRFNAYSDDEA